MRPSFFELAQKHGTDKASLHGYDRWYSRYFEPLRDRPLRLLEIGIYKGASLRLWEEYFPNAEIFGIEYDQELVEAYEGRAKVFLGKQEDVTFLEQVYAQTGPLDVVIDDGGHMWGPQQISYSYFWPRVNYGGFYVLEDLHTTNDPAYREDWHLSTFDYLQEICRRCTRGPTDVEFIHFYRGICFARRKAWSHE